MDKSQYRLLSANEIDKFDGYDRVVAQSHIANVGCIIVDSTYGDPIDNEYDLEEIYQAIESTKMYESKNRKNMGKNTIRLTESEFRKIISESVERILKESNYNLSGEEKYPQYNHDADRWWKLEFESNPEAAAKKAQSAISKFENSDYRLYANEKDYYRDRAFATFGKKYLKMNGYL